MGRTDKWIDDRAKEDAAKGDWDPPHGGFPGRVSPNSHDGKTYSDAHEHHSGNSDSKK